MVEILYKDREVLVCIKPSGTLSENSDAANCLPRMIIEENEDIDELYTVHRLDREVQGVMVFACTQSAASSLSRAVAEGELEKIYLARTEAPLDESSGTLVDLLFKDSKKNKSYVVKRERRGVKRASLEYRELSHDERGTLYHIKLHTGRTHQIRVQLSSRGAPIIGDRKYGASETCEMMLASHIIEFPHPRTGKSMRFEFIPEFAKCAL